MIRLILTFFLCSSCALAGQSTRLSRKAEILRLEEAWRSAQQHNDRAAFDRLLAPDVTFVGTSGSLRDKKGYAASRAGSWIPRATTYTVGDLSVRFYGRVGIVTGTEETTGEGVTNKGRFTHVWARRAGRWQLVAIQRTDIAAF
jgi:ketosteroid isomerase-like protein